MIIQWPEHALLFTILENVSILSLSDYRGKNQKKKKNQMWNIKYFFSLSSIWIFLKFKTFTLEGRYTHRQCDQRKSTKLCKYKFHLALDVFDDDLLCHEDT